MGSRRSRTRSLGGDLRLGDRVEGAGSSKSERSLLDVLLDLFLRFGVEVSLLAEIGGAIEGESSILGIANAVTIGASTDPIKRSERTTACCALGVIR